MLDPKEFVIDEQKFRYTPLCLTPARELYSDLFSRFGDVAAGFIEVFELTDDLAIDGDTEVNSKTIASVLTPLTKSIGSAIRELTTSVNAPWLKGVMDKVLCPQLEIINDANNWVPVDSAWYETNMLCSTEIHLFLKILSIQYSDFLGRWEKAKNIIEATRESIKSLTSQKDSTGK